MDSENKLKFTVSTECTKNSLVKAFTDNSITIDNIIKHICDSSIINKRFISSTHDNTIGRIDLDNSNIISIDFMIKNMSIGKRNSGFTLGGSSISDGVWGNFWEIDMYVVTIFGNRNFIQSFKVTLPMLSNYSSNITERKAKLRHKKLVSKYLDESINNITSYLEHFIRRIEE